MYKQYGTAGGQRLGIQFHKQGWGNHPQAIKSAGYRQRM